MSLKLIKWLWAVLVILSFACNNTNVENGSNPEKQDTIPESLKALNEKILANSNDAELYNKRASVYLSFNNIDSAFRDINKALGMQPENPDFYSTLSDVYMAAGMVQNALASLEKALSFDPENINALLKKAELHLYFEQYGQTLEITEKALTIDKVNPKAYFIRGMTFKLKGDTTNAIKNIQKCVEQDQENYHAYMQLGLLFAAKHNPLAVEYYNNALNLDPKSTEALYGLGMYYQENGFLNEALAAYSNLLMVDSAFKYAHFNMGYIHLVELKMYKEAIKYFNKAIACAPDYYEAYYNRGYSYELLGDILNAREDYKKALSIKTNYELAVEGLNRLDKFK